MTKARQRLKNNSVLMYTRNTQDPSLMLTLISFDKSQENLLHRNDSSPTRTYFFGTLGNQEVKEQNK